MRLIKNGMLNLVVKVELHVTNKKTIESTHDTKSRKIYYYGGFALY
jgi:hypothetical protein